MCGIWDWQSTIVKDLNDSQDPKHTLICRENAFVAIYALFSDNKCPLFTRLGGGSPKEDIVHFFYRFSYMMASLSRYFLYKRETLCRLKRRNPLFVYKEIHCVYTQLCIQKPQYTIADQIWDGVEWKSG